MRLFSQLGGPIIKDSKELFPHYTDPHKGTPELGTTKKDHIVGNTPYYRYIYT